MRDCFNSRSGFDRVLMAVAATFLTVSATSAMAQGDQARSTAAELAIDAAIPRPEPANVPPPTASDFKMDPATAAAAPAQIQLKPAEVKPADTAAAPTASPPATVATTPAVPLPAPATASTEPASPAPVVAPELAPAVPLAPATAAAPSARAAPHTGAPREGRNCAPRRSAGRRQAQRHADGKTVALFRSQSRPRGSRKILWRTRICADLDASRQPDGERQGRHRPPQGRGLR